MKNLYIRYTFLLTALLLLSSCAIAADSKALAFTANEVEMGGDKYEFCGDNSSYYSNGKKNFWKKDLREVTVSAGGLLEVDGQQNGGISVVGENRSDILIRACVKAWAVTEADAVTSLNNTRIQTSGVIRGENADSDARYSISYKIIVPMQQDLKLSAKNGGISIKSVNGNLRFKTQNGGISLKEVAGDVQGKTTNGGVMVKLSGNSFNGNGLDVTTTNGGVKLFIPSNYAADIETGTVNGGFKSDFAELKVEKDGRRRWNRRKKVNASINGGGVKIRVMTTNGGVRIATAE